MTDIDGRRLADRARALIDALDDDGRSALCLAFDDESERRSWFYWPAPRKGLALTALSADQRALVHQLVAAALRLPAYAKVVTIIALEDVLAEMEGDSTRAIRNAAHYFTTIFGDPGDGPWSLRFEGHHVSIHVTVAGDEIAPTPLFLGSNPAEVVHDGRVVVRPLAEEEDVARSLLLSLDVSQRRRAVIDDVAPDDIVTTNAPRVEHDLDGGVAVADLSGEARALADGLVRIYSGRSSVRRAQVRLDDLHFAWAGPAERGRPHYYRLSGPRFLAEYDNTQNDANHAHAVWRDPADDFGDDLLRAHRASMHG